MLRHVTAENIYSLSDNGYSQAAACGTMPGTGCVLEAHIHLPCKLGQNQRPEGVGNQTYGLPYQIYMAFVVSSVNMKGLGNFMIFIEAQHKTRGLTVAGITS